jgi:hypothetical protein
MRTQTVQRVETAPTPPTDHGSHLSELRRVANDTPVILDGYGPNSCVRLITEDALGIEHRVLVVPAPPAQTKGTQVSFSILHAHDQQLVPHVVVYEALSSFAQTVATARQYACLLSAEATVPLDVDADANLEGSARPPVRSTAATASPEEDYQP